MELKTALNVMALIIEERKRDKNSTFIFDVSTENSEWGVLFINGLPVCSLTLDDVKFVHEMDSEKEKI